MVRGYTCLVNFSKLSKNSYDNKCNCYNKERIGHVLHQCFKRDPVKKFLIKLKDKNTGETKEIFDEVNDIDPEDSYVFSEHELISFRWEEGNDSCDCNRFIHFYPESEESYPCGDERFELISINLALPDGLEPST